MTTTEKRGRPRKTTNTFDVNDLLCEYLTTKVDKYSVIKPLTSKVLVLRLGLPRLSVIFIIIIY